MRIDLLGGIIVALAGVAIAAPTSSTQPSLSSTSTQAPTRKEANKMITLSGCVQTGEAGADHFTFSEATGAGKGETTYRLSGADVHSYVGRRVQIVGSYVNRRLQIKGGLVPSANSAAQAGAVDPTRLAMTDAGAAAGTRPDELREFRVRSVKALTGSCPEP